MIVVVDISLLLLVFCHTENTPISNPALFNIEQIIKKEQGSLKPCAPMTLQTKTRNKTL
jgi:hypothetical protein